MVADAGLLSKNNLNKLAEQKYQFILGARIKNESEKIKQKILVKAKDIKDQLSSENQPQSFTIDKPNGLRLVITYSDKRARKDAYNRKKGLKKLQTKVKTGKLTKENINNRGYNKFLIIDGSVRVAIDESKIKADEQWDGLKGYITNTKLSPKKIVENYSQLWQIEKAFRISKTDLRIRPIHHYKKRRIESHICIAFVAYTIYKELERLLYKYEAGFSVKRAVELTHNMYEIECVLPEETFSEKFLLNFDKEQSKLYEIVSKI